MDENPLEKQEFPDISCGKYTAGSASCGGKYGTVFCRCAKDAAIRDSFQKPIREQNRRSLIMCHSRNSRKKKHR